jgi:hypothetical protein
MRYRIPLRKVQSSIYNLSGILYRIVNPFTPDFTAHQKWPSLTSYHEQEGYRTFTETIYFMLFLRQILQLHIPGKIGEGTECDHSLFPWLETMYMESPLVEATWRLYDLVFLLHRIPLNTTLPHHREKRIQQWIEG